MIGLTLGKQITLVRYAGEAMKKTELRRMAGSNIREICHLSQMQVFATSYYQRNYFQMQIDHRTEELLRLLDSRETYAMGEGSSQMDQPREPVQTDQQGEPDLVEFTAEELVAYNGEEGKPIYVAMNGTVYDLSSVRAWEGGMHNGLKAGQDLSEWFMNCHMGVSSVLEKYPKVGVLKLSEENNT